MTLILVAGSVHATIADHGLTIRNTIQAHLGLDGPHHIYLGDARGVDAIVTHLAPQCGWTLRRYEPRWEECAADCPAEHRKPYRDGRGQWCPTADRRADQQMIGEFKAAGGTIVLAFPALAAKSSGTRGCIRAARRAGLSVPKANIVRLPIAAQQ